MPVLSKEEGVTTKDFHQVHDGEIPILFPLRYRPEAEGRCAESPSSDAAGSPSTPTRQSRLFFGRRAARAVVDSLLPEPLRPRYGSQNQKKQVRINLMPSRVANASTAAVYNMELDDPHEPRPSSSVYDDDDPWADSTATTWPHDEGSPGSIKSGTPTPRETCPSNAVESKQDEPETTGNHKVADTHEAVDLKEPSHPHHLPSKGQTPTGEPKDMYSQLAALRVPIQRKFVRLPDGIDDKNNEDDEKTALLLSPSGTTGDTHVPFDSIDPYHLSGQPKKKVLYGPDGYLGKNKEWKQTNFQRITEKVESLGNRVKRGIQRTIERDHDDNRMELLHGIVMKPSIAINVDPEAQSEIYSKLELFMCISANTYLLTQMHNHRFVGNDSVKRFVNYWKAKNRPVVPEFQFDMKTQRDIIVHNVRSFDFPGRYGIDPILLKATLDGWGNVINQLNVRTYCWPDSAIRKLFHDVLPILEMLDASKEILATFLDINHIVVGLIQEAKYKKRMEELKRESLVRDSI